MSTHSLCFYRERSEALLMNTHNNDIFLLISFLSRVMLTVELSPFSMKKMSNMYCY